MKGYWHFWYQGWRFQLAMLLFNIALVLMLLPIAYAFDLEESSYYLVAIPIFVFALVPLGGFLYCSFKPEALTEIKEG